MSTSTDINLTSPEIATGQITTRQVTARQVTARESTPTWFDDPVAYLARFGIKSSLVFEETLPLAA